MKKFELIQKLQRFNDSADIVFEIDNEILDDPKIFANPSGCEIDGEITIIDDLYCCVIKFD